MKYTVSQLYLYPIKSFAGISFSSAKAEEMGFENDRRWMLIDENNQAITQRENPELSQFYPKIIKDKIVITYQNNKHEFFIGESLKDIIFSKVWDDAVLLAEVNKETSKWCSDALGFACKLVKIIRKGDRKHTSSQLHKTLNVSLADGYPYLLVGTESLDFLNKKLEEKVAIQRFRPNIVIQTQTQHEEDFFDTFRIGNVLFKNAKPCSRCIIVNTNPENGLLTKEPLKTLSAYRNIESVVCFGTNVVCLEKGVIAVGDVLGF